MSTSAEAASYAAAVRTALQDVPAPALADLLDDLDEHLAELAAETGPDLVATLGPPAAYAEQLRRAAGLTTAPRTARRGPFDDLADALAQARENEAVAEVVAFLPQLRPAWWLLRGWLVVIALGLLFDGGSAVLLPFGLLGVPLIAAAVVVSVRLGRHALSQPPGDGGRVAAAVSNAVLGLVALLVVVGVQQQETAYVYADVESPPSDATLTTRDGWPITNLFPYSADGDPLSGVLLYDQEGRAVDNLSTDDNHGETLERVVPTDAPPPPSNAYPQQQRRYDPYAETPPPVRLTPPAPTPSLSPSVTPTAIPTLPPTAEPTVSTAPTEPGSPTATEPAAPPAAPPTQAPAPSPS